MLILCVEDNPQLRVLLDSTLESEGYDRVLAEGGQQGLELATTWKPDLVLLDVMMPHMNGFEVLRRLRELPDHAETPVIFLTALGDEEPILEGFELGAVDWVTKPFDIDVLLAKVRVALGGRKTRSAETVDPDLEGAPPEVLQAAAEGAILDKYVVLDEVGSGGMGTVHLAWDSRLKTWVALKFLHDDLVLQDSERFYHEARAVAQMTHPNICQVYDVRDFEDGPYIAMQFIDGILAEQRMPPRIAADNAMQMALALEHVHAKGMLHRDVKPHNVIIEARTGRPYLLDFGLVMQPVDGSYRLSPGGLVVGTACYMSPERLTRKGAPTPLWDVYGLGATLYHWLTGVPPFEAEHEDVSVLKVVHEAVIPPTEIAGEIPAELELVCLQALAKDPALRYQTAGQMAQALSTFLDRGTG